MNRIIVIVALAFCTIFPALTHAQQPPLPAWFTAHMRIGSTQHPQGIRIHAVNDTLEIWNSTATPLVIFMENSNLPDSTIPRPTARGAHYKVVANQLYTIASNHIDWHPSNEAHATITLAELFLYAPELEDRNRYSPNRPPDARVPEQQTASIVTFYGEMLIDVPVTLYYEPNQNYANEVNARQEPSISKFHLGILVIVTIVTIGNACIIYGMLALIFVRWLTENIIALVSGTNTMIKHRLKRRK